MRRALIACGLAVVLIASLMASPIRAQSTRRTPTPTPTPENLLKNGGFEGAFTRQWNVANDIWVNGRVAEGWMAWWRDPGEPDSEYPGRCPQDDAACQPWHDPEYRETRGIPYTPPRIRSGDNSQMYFTSFGLHEGGVYQRAVGVPKGWRVTFTIWARAWSNDTEDTAESSGQPSLNVQAGIDPTGGIDPWGSTVIWSQASDTLDAWVENSVSALAQSDAVTVFFRSRPDRALKHVDVVVDDAQLILIGPPPPTPVIIDSPNNVAGAPAQVAESASPQIIIHIVQPGDTLFGIAQQYHADLSAIYALNELNETSVLKIGQAIQVPLPIERPPTPIPTPEPPAPQPVAAGTLCVGAFEDVAGDGRYAEDDTRLPDAAFTITDGQGRTLIVSNTAQCLNDLAAGAYVVSVQLPAGYLATTDTRWGVALAGGARVEVAAGGRRVEPNEQAAPATLPGIAIGTGSIVILASAVIIARRLRRI